MRRLAFSLGLLLAALTNVQAQWQIQQSHTSSSLRGIHSIGKGVAWASGTEGAVLRTTDGGGKWQACSTPPGAEKLDFRGIQAFDRNTAIVISSGPGDLSRLYKTTDGCRTWKLILTNPDPNGFWDAIQFRNRTGLLYGDPVQGQFVEFSTADFGETWLRLRGGPSARDREGIFAASNSSLLLLQNGHALIVTGGPAGSRSVTGLVGGSIPLAASESAGAFSVAASPTTLVAVGGDYRKPDASQGTAAFSTDGGQHWTAATTPPHGYRSSVAYDSRHKTWIAVGPNGTDISTDDGRNWRGLNSGADGNWNALSLPFAVGPDGRIGKRP
jgi:photosystem II stability/assembly factor-like uncharacterized protein